MKQRLLFLIIVLLSACTMVEQVEPQPEEVSLITVEQCTFNGNELSVCYQVIGYDDSRTLRIESGALIVTFHQPKPCRKAISQSSWSAGRVVTFYLEGDNYSETKSITLQ